MEKIEYKGIWWLPSNPDNQVAGILTLIPEKGIELELFDVFLSESHDLVDTLNSYNNLVWPIEDIILGVSEKKLITLWNCTSKGFSLSKFIKGGYRVSSIILGYHFHNMEDIVCSKITVTFNSLTTWINNRVDFQFEPSDFKNKYEIKEFYFNYIKRQQVLANITQGQISIFDHPMVIIKDNLKQLKINCSGYFDIEINHQLSLEKWLVDFVDPLCDFLTFSTGEINKVKRIYLHLEDQQELEVLDAQMDFQDYDSSLFPENKMLLKLTDIQDDFSLIMQRWFNMYQNIESVLDSYFGVQYNSKLYGENHFLMLAQAVESYHRKTKRNHILSKEEHDQRIQKILDSTPEEYREWLKEKLNFSNELTLKERIEELVNLHWLVMKNIVLDKEQFIKDVKNTRNYYTHFSENLKDKALGGEPLFRLTQKLNFLLQACFLSELGCTPEKCLELISRNGEYTYLQRLVNQEKAN